MLLSESPKRFDAPWQIRLERILVDLATDRLLGRIVPESEKDNVFHNAFDSYLVDVDTMVRYAKRKGASKKILDTLDRYLPEADLPGIVLVARHIIANHRHAFENLSR